MSEGGGEMVATFNHAQGLHWHGTTPDSMRAIADIAESTERKAGESGFEIAASADSEFVPAHARIEPSDDLGSDMRVVHLFSPEVPKPTHARYAWRSCTRHHCSTTTACPRSRSPSSPVIAAYAPVVCRGCRGCRDHCGHRRASRAAAAMTAARFSETSG